MKFAFKGALVACVVFAFAAQADARRVLGLVGTETAKSFARKAAVSDQFEIQSSQLALQKSQNQDIKQFAQQMIDDHTASTQKLKTALQNANMPVPEEALDSSHQKMLDKLKSSGTDFDSLYLKDQQQGHKQALEMLERYSKNGDNDQLKSFAAEILPTVQHHSDMVNALRKNKTASR